MSNNFTFFFNVDSDGRTAVWLRSIFPFRQKNGLESGTFPYEDGMLQSALLPAVLVTSLQSASQRSFSPKACTYNVWNRF